MKKHIPAEIITLIGIVLWLLRFVSDNVFTDAFGVLGTILFLSGAITLIVKKIKGRKQRVVS